MIKKLMVAALFAVLSISSRAQVIFEKGYFISDSNERLEVLIKNLDWKSNPDEFKYMIKPDGLVQQASVQDVKEFGIDGASKYIKANVKIDRSGIGQNKLSSGRNPEFQEETVFLKVLVEGYASLYLYEDGNLTRFFYAKGNSDIRPLVYKRYLQNGQIEVNNTFREQLLNDFQSQGISIYDVKSIKYYSKELEPLFIRLNEKNNVEFTVYTSHMKKDLFNLTFRPGISRTGFSMQNSVLKARSEDFGKKLNFRLGFEAEFILPFNKNKWSVIAEPTYQYYNAIIFKEKNYEVSVNYKSIEVPIGVRHYFFLNQTSKIFINASFLMDYDFNSTVEFTTSDGNNFETYEIESPICIPLGIGYKHKERLSMEVRYLKRDVFGRYTGLSADYKSLSLIVGYSIIGD